MSVVSFSGLASGIDSASLITKLVAAEKAGADPYTKQQTNLSSQKTIVDGLATAMSSLGSLARDMSLPSSLAMRSATSSDSHLSVSVSGTADTGTHSVRVNNIAQAQVSTSNTFSSSSTAGVAGSGTLTLTSGSTTANITYDATDTLSTIAGKINDANAGASASVLFDGTNYRLVVNSKQTGVANAATFTDTGSALGLADPANIKVPAKDASLTVDGVDISRPTNVITDALPGMTLTANSAALSTETATNVVVSNDVTSLTTKMQSFVSAFNAIATAVKTQLTYNASATSQSPLFGDSTMRQLQGALGSLATQTYNGASIDSLGLSIDKDGIMGLDSTKLATALSTNPDAIKDFFVTDSFGTKVSAMSDMYSETGDGVLHAKSDGLTDQFNILQKQIDQINDNADALQKRLQDQFTALETAESGLQAQLTYINKLFSSSSS